MAASADLVESVRELVVMDSASALRWFQHDYPHPLARWHHHPEIEIHLITGSSGTAQIGAAARAFGPGDLYLIGSELPHNWVSSIEDGETVPGRDMLIQADPALLAQVADLVPDLNRVPPLLEVARQGIQYSGATRERAVQVLEDIRDRRGVMRFAGLLELLDVLAGAPASDRELLSERIFDAPLGSEESEIFHRAVTYLHDHLGERVQLADIAREIRMSESHVSRLFSRATGVGFSRTVIRLRVSEACRLLLRTDLPVADVCFRAGFTNLSNFNRRFHEETGTTPRAYRAAGTVE